MSAVGDVLVLAVSWIIVAAYTWSVRGHFASDHMPFGAAVIAVFVTGHTIAFSVLTWIWDQPIAAQLAGVALQLAAGGLFVAAILASRQARLKFVFDAENPHGLVTSGPYAHMRHPFYASYVLFWLGWALSLWTFWVIPSAILFIVLYVQAARMEEAKFAGTPLAEDYAAYRSRTEFFWPKLTFAR